MDGGPRVDGRTDDVRDARKNGQRKVLTKQNKKKAGNLHRRQYMARVLSTGSQRASSQRVAEQPPPSNDRGSNLAPVPRAGL
jgi:hypothetical protein